MATVLHPWKILVAAMAGWITRQQDAAIEYLREENRVLKQQLGPEMGNWRDPRMVRRYATSHIFTMRGSGAGKKKAVS